MINPRLLRKFNDAQAMSAVDRSMVFANTYCCVLHKHRLALMQTNDLQLGVCLEK